ncbi:Alpha/beta hydrolase fold-1 [Geopyxis carbonaria]|nr:Alpha/beta hydrolase fold-1 [Geopyxis carbonaria]
MSSTKPTVLFVPGAWHTDEGFAAVRELLEAADFPTAAVAHPSIGAEPPNKHLTDDSDHLRKAITELADAGKEIVLIVHSYGGCVGSIAVEGLSVARRKAEGKTGGVIMFVYMAAFVTPLGKSLKDMLGGVWLPWMLFDEAGYSTPKDPATIFYNDMTPEDQAHWVSKLKHSSGPVFSDPVTYEPWKEVPCMYLYCEKDNGIPLPVQQMMAETLGADRTDFSLPASHSPFLSMPAKVVEAVELAAKVGQEKAQQS